ncbi:putative ATPase [Blastocladiella emersonii ATCC 22665]|nr:putative ATPase [Blastocladiella emersonii ATCC 22665]
MADSFLGWFDFELEGTKLNRDKILNLQLTNQLVTKMHQILGPFMLRRVKADVNLNLPPKKELVVTAPLTREQRDLFTAVRENTLVEYLTAKFEALDVRVPRTRELSVGLRHKYMAVRRLSCHPFLFPHPEYPIDYEPEASLVARSGKMMLLDQILRALLVDEADQKHKVLLFSQYTTFLTIVQYYLESKGWGHARLDGSVGHEERKAAIAKFHNDPECKLFLLSTKAGGLGLNLVAADTVVLLDSSDNPAVDLQAMDRAHRMGQDRPVTVFRFISEFEQMVYERAQSKRQLEKMVIGQGKLNDKTGLGSSSEPDAAAASSSSAPTTAAAVADTEEDGDGKEQAAEFNAILEQLLQEVDGESIQVLKPGQDAISEERLARLLAMRAKLEDDV